MPHDTGFVLLLAGFFAAAALYSSVGHGGASAFLAIMALIGLAPDEMRPIALTLNLLVAGLGAWRFIRARRFDGRLFWPLALGAVPFAFLGGAIRLPAETYRIMLGAVLLFSAARLAFLQVPGSGDREPKPPPPVVAVAAGAGIGLLAGLTGTGGGIFLSPLMIFLGWARPITTTGIASLFIFVNSAAGLAGNHLAVRSLPADLPWMVAAAGAGAVVGTSVGLRFYDPATLRRALALVMLIAGLKLVLT